MRSPISVWERHIGLTESPIELLFLNAFCKLALDHGYGVERMSTEPAWVITVEPQRWFGHYRVDFLISYAFFGRTLRLVVECDGHDFHERTKAQAIKDRRRDRALQSQGLKVFRFTGSEITAAPSLCAMEALDEIEIFQSHCIMDAYEIARKKAA